MSKVRVYELAQEMGVTHQIVEEACRGLGIDVVGKHMTHLSPDDADRVRSELRGGGRRDGKETVVDGNVVRRRRKVDDGPAQANVQVAGGAGSVATSPTTVRRKKAPSDEPAVVVEPVRAEVRAPVAARPTAAEVRAPVAEVRPPVAEVRPPAAEVRAPAAEVRAPVAEVRVPAAETSAVTQVTTEVEGPKAVASSAPAAAGPAAGVAPAPETSPPAAAVAGEPEGDDGSPQSLVKVIRRVDDAIMQNILAEAQRRAERQAASSGRGRPGSPPTGRGVPRVGPPSAAPAAGAPPAGAPAAQPGDDRRGRTGAPVDPSRGRVAWDRGRDKGFNDHTARGKGRRRMGGPASMPEPVVQRAAKRIIKIEDTVTVGELAAHLSVKASAIIKKLMLMGEMVTVNNVLDMDTVSLLAQEPEFNFEVENVAFDIENYIPKVEEGHGELVARDPVVTVMGHVDHGKTSLLDAIRRARVAQGEAGGITQHIGAYKVPVTVNGQQRHVVFLDTPGHAAFSAMRARGAQVTDVVILVVAADDGVKPQTIEAVNHAKAAGVPIVVAVTKVDKSDARPDKVRQQLTEYGVVSEEWGGEAQFVDVSSKAGIGIDQLLESVVLQADILELKAIVDRSAKGVVIEAELSKGRGPVATVLVQEGTLNRGDIVVSGTAMGRVRAMIDDRGKSLASVGPATPVEVLGLDSVPPPSEQFIVVKDERDAKAIVSHLEDKQRKGRLAEERKKVSLDDLFAQMEAGEVKTLNLVIKSDVQGSLEALRVAFGKLKHPELEVRIIHDAVGAISEHDVYLASASNAIIIGFNVRPEKNAKTLAEQDKVDIKLYSVIYNAVDDMKLAMEGMLKPTIEEKFVGRAAVRETFSIPKIGVIAGCAVLQGKLIRGYRMRLLRDNRVMAESRISGLRRFKDQVAEVDRGHECGVHIDNYSDIKIGDEIECYELIEIAQKLELADEV